LAMSRCLTERSIDHLVLERGEVANSWKTERWDSLRLLTPNWHSRLPGYRYQGSDPDGYRTMPETVAFLERYAQAISAPVQAHTTIATRISTTSTAHAACRRFSLPATPISGMSISTRSRPSALSWSAASSGFATASRNFRGRSQTRRRSPI